MSVSLILLIIVGYVHRERACSRSTTPLETECTNLNPSTRQMSSQDEAPDQTETAGDEVAAETHQEQVGNGPVRAVDIAGVSKRFDPERAMEHIAYLASDELEGRQPGTPGGRAAGGYIAEQFAACGLQPAGVDATYYQTFTLPYGRLTTRPVLEIADHTGERLQSNFIYRTDYRALTGGYVGAGEGRGPVVWLNECRHEDYRGLDVVDKIVLCRSSWGQEVYREAIAHGVGGLLLLERETGGEPFRRGGYRETAWVPETIPAYLISDRVGRDLLAGTDHTLDSLTLRYSATPLSTTVGMTVTTEEEEAVVARNVLGLLPGSDPLYDDELVVLGSHYDHLGPEPDGAIMNGANDNASGVATLLEIARLWQAEGFRPARSVLFAAWDGEEQGLLGSRHYVAHPTQSISHTVSMLNLDMVGAGEALQVDGQGPVAEQLSVTADAYGETVTSTTTGRSDHVPFYGAGVPAAMLIWWPDELYHTPGDEVSAIDFQQLRTAGVLASHTLGAMAGGQIELQHAIDRLEAAVAAGDREAFGAMLASTDPSAQGNHLRWFDSLWSRGLAEVDFRADNIGIGIDDASVVLRVAPRWDGQDVPDASISYPARFTVESGMWRLAGYHLEEASAEGITVASFVGSPVEAADVLTPTWQAYAAIAADLGAEPVAGTRLIYYPDADTLRALTCPTAEKAMAWQVLSSDVAELAVGLGERTPITPALVSLVLNQMGLPPDEGEWLRVGLSARYETSTMATFLPPLVSEEPTGSLWFSDRSLSVNTERHAVKDADPDSAPVFRACAWSAADYLLEQYGRQGLRSFCAAWEGAGAHEAFAQGLGVAVEAFEEAWRRSKLDPLRTASTAIDETIARREQAVIDGDEAAFLSTVTTSDPFLRAEDRSWFRTLVDGPLAGGVVSYTVRGEVVGWAPEENEARVMVDATTIVSGSQPFRVSFESRFVGQSDRWLYAGEVWDVVPSQHYLIYVEPELREQAGYIVEQAEDVYDQVTADLGATPSLPQRIRVFSDEARFRTTAAYRLPEGDRAWTAPGESIRLLADPEDEDWLRAGVAQGLARQVLYEQGLDSLWIHEGASAFAADRVLPLGDHWGAAVRERVVRDALARREALRWSQLNGVERLQTEDVELIRAQAWSWIDKIVRDHGCEGLTRFINEAARDTGAAVAMRDALGVGPEAFVSAWRDDVQSYAPPEGLVAMARQFDVERAMGHVETLSSAKYAGREAGSAGAERAAAYIAEEFASLGLAAPSVGLPSPVVTTSMTGTPGDAYFQRFPISYTRVTTVPTFSLLGTDGAEKGRFAYRRHFVEVGGRGAAEGELVWLESADLDGLRFDGALVVESGVGRPFQRAATLGEHGAGGLIIVTDRPSETIGKWVGEGHGSRLAESIPVLELSKEGSAALLEVLHMKPEMLASAPRVLPLGVRAMMTVRCTPWATVQSANVLGMWPGSDTRLSQEVLVVGAHYDHVGRLPDGTIFPGANQNASGVAALLELARVLKEEGYQPARSVLFAAWSGEERDSAGVSHYLAHPTVPLTRTVGVISLDSIADGNGYRLWFWGDGETDGALTHRLEGSAARLGGDAWRKGSSDQGWHHLFKTEGVPSVKLTWAESDELSYRIEDTADGIDAERLASSGQIVALAVWWLAGG